MIQKVELLVACGLAYLLILLRVISPPSNYIPAPFAYDTHYVFEPTERALRKYDTFVSLVSGPMGNTDPCYTLLCLIRSSLDSSYQISSHGTPCVVLVKNMDSPAISYAWARVSFNKQLPSIAGNGKYTSYNISITSLAGQNFRTGATVAIITENNTVNADDVIVVSENKITCTIPFDPAAIIGTWKVVVTNTGGKASSGPDSVISNLSHQQYFEVSPHKIFAMEP